MRILRTPAALLAVLALVLPAVLASRSNGAAPNVLLIMADDCTYNDLPVYGGVNAKTPNIDRLASEGLVFENAYLAAAMCQPCRAELYTGQYPLTNGCSWNHSASRPDTRSLPHYLGERGYRVGIAGKVHVKPAAAFPFQNVSGFDKSCVRNPTRQHSLEAVERFMTSNRQQPFCLVVALVEPHVPWVMGDASKYPPGDLKLPPNLADTKLTREAFSRYLAEITYMDGQVGQLLELLDQSDLRDDTLVLFTSEQGSQFPGCKWTNWDTGVHTALIARWPGQIAAGERTKALVQYADVAPTLVELVDRKPPSGFDGKGFLPVLLGQTNSHREFVYGIHNNMPEGPSYPIRTISDGQFRYIENLQPEQLYIEKHLMGLRGEGTLNNPYWGTWVFNSADSPRTYSLVKRYLQRPAEQLYHTAEDPYEMRNLAEDSEWQSRKATLRKQLHQWRRSQGDPGPPLDTKEALQAARQGKHLYYPKGSDE